MKTIGFWPMSLSDADMLTFSIANELGSATISGTPTVTGVNCTASYVSHTAQGTIVVKVSAGTYAGSVQVSATLTDTRKIDRQVDLRFL